MKNIRCVTGLLIIIVALLSGCGQVETGIPVTEIPQEMTTDTPVPPTQMATVPVLTAFPSLTPAFVYAPDEGEPVYPLASLRILSPGDGSRLASPIVPELSILLGVENTVEVELLNSTGEMLVKKLLQYPGVGSSQRILIRPEIDFEIDGDEEGGRLVVKTQDAFGRLISLVSCDLTLLSLGEPTIKAAKIPYEAFLITDPVAGVVLRGGIVTVSGYARSVGTSAIVIELVDEDGVEISNRVLLLSGDPGGAPIVFTTTLPYQVERETAVRLILRQTRDGISGPAVVTSLLLSVR